MKFLFDLFPIILFFIAFKFFDIYVATAVAIAATIAQIVYSKLKHGTVDKMLIISGVLIVVFGGATLFLKDPVFIQWKPSILYWLFATTLIGAQLFFKKNLMRSFMEKQIALPDAIWSKVNLAWAALFLVLGFLNLYVAFHYSQDTWVNFKLFGITGIMFVFIIAQTLLLTKYYLKNNLRTTMWYAIIAEDTPNSLEKRLSARSAHLERLNALQNAGRLLLAGPFPAIDSIDSGVAGFTGSLIVAEFNDLSEAQDWANQDPFVIADVYANVTVKPFRKTLPN